MSGIKRYKAELDALIKIGETIEADLRIRFKKGKSASTNAAHKLEDSYQNWYSEASFVIKQLLPDRLEEFHELYKGDGRRKRIESTNFNIQDLLRGLEVAPGYYGTKAFDELAVAGMRFVNQLDILKSAERRFHSRLFDIKQLVQADLFDSELDAARELSSRGFLRAAGAVAGVVLEKHLSQVADNHKISTRMQNPTISDFNDLLKSAGVLDVPPWRQIQRLGDIRNLCTHNKNKEPTIEEVDELISGVDKYTKTLF